MTRLTFKMQTLKHLLSNVVLYNGTTLQGILAKIK
jgi:hypothetical protein